MPQVVSDLLWHLGRNKDVDDITGCQPDQEKDKHRDAKQHGHGIEESAKGIGPHAYTSPSAPDIRRVVAHLGPTRSSSCHRTFCLGVGGCAIHLHSMSTPVKSWNQLCALTKPLTFLVIARGLRSWTMNPQGASLTMISCARCVSLRISALSLDFSMRSISWSNSSFFQLAQLRPFGAALVDRK